MVKVFLSTNLDLQLVAPNGLRRSWRRNAERHTRTRILGELRAGEGLREAPLAEKKETTIEGRPR